MENVKFSIIVPIYKVEKFIDRCVESLIRQTYSNIEIILVDDGSPDKCPEICDSYAEIDNRIVVIHKQNGGLSDARNFGIEAASGDYVIFVDSDDYVEVDMCENLFPYSQKNVDVIIGDAFVEGGMKDYSHIKETEIMDGETYLLKAYQQKKAPMVAWLNVYKNYFLKKNKLRFKKGVLHEDEEFTPRALLLANSIIVSGVCFYHYILREDSITTQKDKRKNAIDLFSICCELESLYNELYNDELRKYLIDSLVCKYLSLFQEGMLYQYGETFLHKEFVKRNAKLNKTKFKAHLYCLSPRLYYKINKVSKKESWTKR